MNKFMQGDMVERVSMRGEKETNGMFLGQRAIVNTVSDGKVFFSKWVKDGSKLGGCMRRIESFSESFELIGGLIQENE